MDRRPGDPEWRNVLGSVAELVHRAAKAERTPGARPTIAAPDRPSIAVLPFKNLTADKDSEYFAEAVTEDIVTALSRQHLFFVIASNSSFSYKGRDVELSRVGRELGVRYILQGSIRQLGDRVRVSAQLTDVSDGSNIWADQFNRELVDILAMQDEITERVVAAIEPAMLHSEGMRVVRKSLADFSALDCFYRGMWHLNRVSREGYDQALALFSEAVRRDPELALGHIGLSRILFGGAIFGWAGQPIDDLHMARREAQTAIRLDPRDAYGYFASSGASLYLGDHGAALSEARTAVDLNSNCAPAQVRMGQALIFGGHPKEAIAPLERGMRLSPYDSQLSVMLESLALAHYQVGEYEQAIVRAREAMHQTYATVSVVLAASLAQLGRFDEARAALPPSGWKAGVAATADGRALRQPRAPGKHAPRGPAGAGGGSAGGEPRALVGIAALQQDGHARVRRRRFDHLPDGHLEVVGRRPGEVEQDAWIARQRVVDDRAQRFLEAAGHHRDIGVEQAVQLLVRRIHHAQQRLAKVLAGAEGLAMLRTDGGMLAAEGGVQLSQNGEKLESEHHGETAFFRMCQALADLRRPAQILKIRH